MRRLRFLIDKQIIMKDKKCDFRNIVMGTSGYLLAEFSFSKEWNGLFKVAEFRKRGEDTYYPVKIIQNKCEVPKEVTDAPVWTVKIVGKHKNTILITNACIIAQEV